MISTFTSQRARTARTTWRLKRPSAPWLADWPLVVLRSIKGSMTRNETPTHRISTYCSEMQIKKKLRVNIGSSLTARSLTACRKAFGCSPVLENDDVSIAKPNASKEGARFLVVAVRSSSTRSAPFSSTQAMDEPGRFSQAPPRKCPLHKGIDLSTDSVIIR